MMESEPYENEYTSGWTVCTRCEIEYAEPDQDICHQCFCDLEDEREAQEAAERCVTCDNKHLPDSYLCQECKEWVWGIEKKALVTHLQNPQPWHWSWWRDLHRMMTGGATYGSLGDLLEQLIRR